MNNKNPLCTSHAKGIGKFKEKNLYLRDLFF